MATVSAPNLSFPPTSSPSSSPPIKGLKKVLSGRRRSSDLQNENHDTPRASIDSLTLDRTSTANSARSSPSRDGNSRSSQSTLHKIIPGHNKRQRRKVLEAEVKAVIQEPELRGRDTNPIPLPPPGATAQNKSQSSLLTDGSENDTPPPLISRDSHTGYFTTSSPLISSKAVNDERGHTNIEANLPTTHSTEAFPIILEPDPLPEQPVSSHPPELNLQHTPILPAPGLIDKADTLRVEESRSRRGSISKLRAKSPARKIRDVFSRSGKSPRTSPERASATSLNLSDSGISEPASVSEQNLFNASDRGNQVPPKNPSVTSLNPVLSPKQSLVLETNMPRPVTPPHAHLSTPLTTITPPTPTDIKRAEFTASPEVETTVERPDVDVLERISSHPTNVMAHRRVRSTSATGHQKSKLSLSSIPPLTPTIEESNTPAEKPAGSRNFTAGSGFFSSWVSAAQNAATSITNLTGQTRARGGTGSSESHKTKTGLNGDDDAHPETGAIPDEESKKELAIETLGSGNLDFSHLGLDSSNDSKNQVEGRPDLSTKRQKSDLRREEAEAKAEDILAKRAVSAAYEDTTDGTPVAEASDPIANVRPSQTFDVNASGTLTPPGGSIFEGESGSIKRSNSVRSKIATRRSRGSSIATGQSAIGAMIGASTAAITNPATGSRSTPFTPAPKQRNRTFHQQFRSVPEDDNLIEDYSCALQKEILLAGRIYISEGHICFSSNILGWVTTLIISFEEIVSIERENTAMIIPNAIAVQTLHARHTFRSLLSREATFDLIIGIWRVSSPASFSKSVNGKQMIAEQAQQEAEKAQEAKEGDGDESAGSSGEDSGSEEEDEDEESVPSMGGSVGSFDDKDFVDAKAIPRKPSGNVGGNAVTNGGAMGSVSGDVAAAAAAVAGVPGAAIDFPGPPTHAPTDCTDSATHYENIVKDEIVPAPLGKIYSLMFGPQSGVFLRKYLVDDCKSQDLAFEDDKKGLNNENKTRQYHYIKPLGGSIGPKQTKTITTENLDFFDLEKSVSVTCTTQTPDVPSGSAFSTKTRYCLSWAPGNATRVQMNMTIEWTAKSWLKGPIEKGAKDGQQQYGDGLIKVLKAAVGRSRGATVGSNRAKGKKKKKGDKKSKADQAERSTHQQADWGLFEPLRSTLEPVTSLLGPLMKTEVIVGILSIMVIILWFGGARGRGQGGYPNSVGDRAERMAAYDQLWRREESELWNWLEDRAGISRVMLGEPSGVAQGSKSAKDKRQKLLRDKNMAARLEAEKWSRKEMQEAVRVTQERLDSMQRVLDSKGI